MSSVYDDVLVLFFTWPGRARSPSDSSDSSRCYLADVSVRAAWHLDRKEPPLLVPELSENGISRIIISTFSLTILKNFTIVFVAGVANVDGFV